jgi:UrcA family protein
MNTQSMSGGFGGRRAACGAAIVMALSWLACVDTMADQPARERSVVVKFGDLDLSSADGASALYRRFKHAAGQVCKRPDGGFGDPAVFLHCYHNALARGVRDLGNARVTAHYNVEFKERLPTSGPVSPWRSDLCSGKH